MSELRPGVTGRKPNQRSETTAPRLDPFLVTVKEARRLLGGIGHNLFWQIVKAGDLELVGTERKRWVTVASLKDYVARMPRSQKAAARP